MFVHILLALELFLHSLSHGPLYNLFILFLPLTKYGYFGGEGSKREEQEKSNQDDNSVLTNEVEIRTVE